MPVEKEIVDSLTEYTRDRICGLGIGTGNLFKVGNRFFIVTCLHVVRDFFKSNFQHAVLRNNIRIDKKRLRRINSTNSSLDIAILEIEDNFSPRGFYSTHDIEPIQDFSEYSFSKINLFICGLPSELSNQKAKNVIYQDYLGFMTIPHLTQKHTKDFIYCEYPMNQSIPEYHFQRDTLLPSAKGLSGAFILKVEQFKGSKNELWLPSCAKIIAVQVSWDENRYIKGSNAKYILKLLKS